MCGICGYMDFKGEGRAEPHWIERMNGVLRHRGPDDTGYLIAPDLVLGFTRLSIIDPAGGAQPIHNEDGSLTLICNGEIFNYRELRADLEARGHRFATCCDIEVILHLYEEYGTQLMDRLNGQFAFALYNHTTRQLLCVRDHVGIAPFYYTITGGMFVFASEIKALLEHPDITARIDLKGLDQIMHFPGLVSPRTLFQGIHSLEAGHYLLVDQEDGVRDCEYWDLIYPQGGESYESVNEHDYIEELDDLLTRSVQRRLQADVPVGFYLSGGLDSSLIAAKIQSLDPSGRRHSFSVNITDPTISEAKYQRMMVERLHSNHHEIPIGQEEIASKLFQAVYHAECALKETYNTASLSLSEAAHRFDVKVVLTGEGADELFGGYVGYRFDQMRAEQVNARRIEHPAELEIRRRLWGDEDFVYEKYHHEYAQVVRGLYSEQVNEVYDHISCLNEPIVKQERLHGLDVFHKRSYLDFKLRMSDHLLSDHGDRMALAHSVEARYPFLDMSVINFARRIPISMKLKRYKEKYILKKLAEPMLPQQIVQRPKFAFVAPGSTALLAREREFLGDILSYDTVRRQGCFSPEAVEQLKRQYTQEGFRLNLPYDNDMLIIVITMGLLMQQYNLKL